MKKLSIFFFCLFLGGGTADALNIPERLEYDLIWMGLTAGRAVIEIKKEGNMIKIMTTTDSAKWLSAIYHVEDRIESVANKIGTALQPISYRIHLKEGRHRKDKEVRFDRAGKKALYTDHLNSEKQEFNVPAEIFDPISAFYHIRDMDMRVGKSMYVSVFDSKRVWNIEVKVLGKEVVDSPAGPAGKFNTFVIKPLLKSEGIFSRKGDIHIWLSDDKKKIPVRLKSKIPVGSVTAVLVGGSF